MTRHPTLQRVATVKSAMLCSVGLAFGEVPLARRPPTVFTLESGPHPFPFKDWTIAFTISPGSKACGLERNSTGGTKQEGAKLETTSGSVPSQELDSVNVSRLPTGLELCNSLLQSHCQPIVNVNSSRFLRTESGLKLWRARFVQEPRPHGS